jgi:hypothetical protein
MIAMMMLMLMMMIHSNIKTKKMVLFYLFHGIQSASFQDSFITINHFEAESEV